MSKIEIKEYREDYRDLWETFVDESNNGTMFHKQAFLDYHEPGKFDFFHLTLWESGRLVGVLPGGLKENGRVFWSPVGASYGSIVTKDVKFETALAMIDATMEYFYKNNFKEIFLIPPPIVYNREIQQHLEYAMLYRKFDFELHYISHVVRLDRDDDFLSYFDKTARKTIRKIWREKKIRIEESQDYETFNEILLENKARHNVKPTHSLRDMLRLRELMPDRVRLSLVYFGDEPIAGSWNFLANDQVVLCFYNMLKYEYEKLKPVYLIMHDTVRRAYEEGAKWVDMGDSQDTSAEDPMTPALNLIYFKERFDARGVLRSTFHYKFRN